MKNKIYFLILFSIASNVSLIAQFNLLSNGNVGIGTITPENSEGWNKVLDVYGSSHSKMLVTTSNVKTGLWSHNSGIFGAPTGGIVGTWSDHPFSLITNRSARLTILSNGFVGIGEVNPVTTLHLKNSSTSTIIRIQNSNNYSWSIGNYNTSPWSALNTLAICNADGYPKMEFRQNFIAVNDRVLLGTGYVGNDAALELADQKWITLNSTANSSGIMFYEAGTKSSNSVQYGGKIEYNEGQDALILGTFQGSARNAVFIDRVNGSVGIGGLNNSSTYKFKVFGRAIITGTSWEVSDLRFKDSIKNISDESNKLKRLRGVSYIKRTSIQQEDTNKKDIRTLDNSFQISTDTLKYSKVDSSKKTKRVIPERDYGFIAQEVQKVFPDLVIEDEEGYLAINYTGFIPLLVESFKEQRINIDSLKEKNEQKTIKIDELKQELIALKKNIKNQDERIKALEKLHKIAGTKKSALVEDDEKTVTEILNVNNSFIASLDQNSPNPFNQSTSIGYFLPETTKSATFYIYDMNGIQMKSFPIQTMGASSITIQGSELRPGMYLYTLIADGKEVDTKRMILTE